MKINYSNPEEKGISSKNILDFYRRLEAKHIPMHSVILYCEDSIISEAYFSPFQKNHLHRMFSIAKTLSALGIGILSDRGLLSLDNPIVQYFPEKLPKDEQGNTLPVHPFLAGMTIRHMLMMRTCHANSTYDKFHLDTDWVGSFFTTRPTHPSGTVWHYDTSAAHVLCALVEKITGKNLLDFLREELTPLEIFQNAYMLTDGQGVSMGGSGLVATSEDLLKIGILLMKEGCIDGKQLISKRFLRDACSNLTPNAVAAPLPSEGSGYGYMIWQSEKGGYVCYGMGGQFAIVHPDKQLILVTTADTQGLGGGNQVIYDAFYQTILDNLHDSLDNINGLAQLRDYEAAAHMQPLSACVSGKTGIYPSSDSSILERNSTLSYRLSDNKHRYKNLKLTRLSEYRCCLSFTQEQENGTLCDIPIYFSLYDFTEGILEKYNLKYYGTATWLRDDTLYIKLHIIDSSVGSLHFELYFGDSNVTVFMKKIEETMFQEYQGHLYGEKICD